MKRWVTGGAVVLLVVVLAFGLWWKSTSDDAVRDGLVFVGPTSDFPPGSVVGIETDVDWVDERAPDLDNPGSTLPTPVDQLAVWIVSAEDGSFLALLARDPYLGCRTGKAEGTSFADPDKDVYFADPCHGTRCTRQGTKIDGPSPRGLDEMPVVVSGSDVYVDVGSQR